MNKEGEGGREDLVVLCVTCFLPIGYVGLELKEKERKEKTEISVLGQMKDERPFPLV